MCDSRPHAGLAQVSILDALSCHVAESPKDAEAIIERVLPRLQHANSAVVLSAVKVWRPHLCAAVERSRPPPLNRGDPLLFTRYFLYLSIL